MLSLVLLFFALLLAISTALAGRVFCGFVCFQTVWTDVFTWIEEKFEGPPRKRYQLDQMPLGLHKLRIKLFKHLIWLTIAMVTGISFVAWFTDAYGMWGNLAAFDLPPAAWITIAIFTAFTYVFAGLLREQVCFWLCPYARIQSAMVDKHTVIPTYDLGRGEPRSRVRKDDSLANQGDCVDCNQCVAVCPTGVDIRKGLQEGCIMCALCLDACDHVMDKVSRPRGLIRYASFDELEGAIAPPIHKRGRVWVYAGIMLLSLLGVGFGVSTLEAVELKVLHGRQPLFVLQSDGSIQNKYTLKVLNKTTEDISLMVTASGPEGLLLVGAGEAITARKGQVTPLTLFVRVPRSNLPGDSSPITFRIESPDNPALFSERESIFVGPK